MPKEIEFDDGEVLEIAGILEVMDLLGCTAEELYFWLDKSWMRQHTCETCGTSWPLLEDIQSIAYLAERNPQVGLNELVHKLHIENSRKARQNQLKRRTAALAREVQQVQPAARPDPRRSDPRRSDPRVDPRSQRSYGRHNDSFSADDFSDRETMVVEAPRGTAKRGRRQLRSEELETRSYTTFEAEIPEEYEDVLPRQEPRRGLFGRRHR